MKRTGMKIGIAICLAAGVWSAVTGGMGMMDEPGFSIVSDGLPSAAYPGAADQSKGASTEVDDPKAVAEYLAGGGPDRRNVSVTGEARDYMLLGDLHLQQGNADEAEAAYRRALELNRAPKLYVKLAKAHMMA